MIFFRDQQSIITFKQMSSKYIYLFYHILLHMKRKTITIASLV